MMPSEFLLKEYHQLPSEPVEEVEEVVEIEEDED